MPNAISKLFAVILAILVLYYVPTYQIYKKQEDLAYLNTYETVTAFVDNVRMKGYITPQMYEDFQKKLIIGDVLYDVEMTHKHKLYVPVFSDPANPNSFTGEYQVQYSEYYETQILDVLYGDPTKSIEQRTYKLENGDFFSLYVENKTKFKSTMILDFLTGAISKDNEVVVSVPYGGMILNEDY